MPRVQRVGALRPHFVTLLWAPVQLSLGCGTAVVALPQHGRIHVLGWDSACPRHPRRGGGQAGFAPRGRTGWMRCLPRSWLRFGGSGAEEGGGGDGGKCGSSWRPAHVAIWPPHFPAPSQAVPVPVSPSRAPQGRAVGLCTSLVLRRFVPGSWLPPQWGCFEHPAEAAEGQCALRVPSCPPQTPHFGNRGVVKLPTGKASHRADKARCSGVLSGVGALGQPVEKKTQRSLDKGRSQLLSRGLQAAC